MHRFGLTTTLHTTSRIGYTTKFLWIIALQFPIHLNYFQDSIDLSISEIRMGTSNTSKTMMPMRSYIILQRPSEIGISFLASHHWASDLKIPIYGPSSECSYEVRNERIPRAVPCSVSMEATAPLTHINVALAAKMVRVFLFTHFQLKYHP